MWKPITSVIHVYLGKLEFAFSKVVEIDRYLLFLCWAFCVFVCEIIDKRFQCFVQIFKWRMWGQHIDEHGDYIFNTKCFNHNFEFVIKVKP